MKMIYMNHTIQSGFFKAATKNFFAVAPGKVRSATGARPMDGPGQRVRNKKHRDLYNEATGCIVHGRNFKENNQC